MYLYGPQTLEWTACAGPTPVEPQWRNYGPAGLAAAWRPRQKGPKIDPFSSFIGRDGEWGPFLRSGEGRNLKLRHCGTEVLKYYKTVRDRVDLNVNI